MKLQARDQERPPEDVARNRCVLMLLKDLEDEAGVASTRQGTSA